MTQSVIAPEYVKLIDEWASARNFYTGATAYGQFFKLVSELGEWASGVVLNDREEVIDGLGDTFIVATIMSKQLGSDILTEYEGSTLGHSEFPQADLSMLAIVGLLGDNLAKKQNDKALSRLGDLADALVKTALRYGLDINTCLSRAYSDIKDRQGVMYNGVFVKSTDERYQGILDELAKTAS